MIELKFLKELSLHLKAYFEDYKKSFLCIYKTVNNY